MKNKPVIIKDLIEKFIQENKPKKESLKTQIIDNWDKIVSEEAWPYTKPVMIKNKILIIVVSNSAWLHQLTLNKYRIMEKIKLIAAEFNETEAIKDIRFKIGQIT
ncbi:MAG: DUF721 domain-containing protein [Candidatus Omnitrophota bacterium]